MISYCSITLFSLVKFTWTLFDYIVIKFTRFSTTFRDALGDNEIDDMVLKYTKKLVMFCMTTFLVGL